MAMMMGTLSGWSKAGTLLVTNLDKMKGTRKANWKESESAPSALVILMVKMTESMLKVTMMVILMESSLTESK